MAIYSLQIKAIGRSKGRSVVAAAAYHAGEKIGDDRSGVVWDFTAKRGVLYSEIFTPEGAPEWAKDRAELWNAAERAEDKSTRPEAAKTARDIIVALPHELTAEQRIEATRAFAQSLVERYGVAVDLAIHAPDRHSDDRNYHAHLLISTRRMNARGFDAKTRELDDLTRGPREIEAIRKSWEWIGNRALAMAGHDERIDCRSYVDQGLDREPTVHLGPVASGMERSGEGSELGDRNRAARERNAERARLKVEQSALSAEIIDLATQRQCRADERELRAVIRTHNPPKILDALVERRSTFTRRDLNYVLSKVIPDAGQRSALTDHILALSEVVGLKETEDAPVSRYTTRAVLAGEAKVLDDAAVLAGQDKHCLTVAQAESALGLHPGLKPEQREAFYRSTLGEGLLIIAGESATGKSTVLKAVRDGYEAAGYRVVGMCWTNMVVQDMRRDGYREAVTVTSELGRLESGEGRWDKHTVLIVDEAALLATQPLARIMAEARASGAKVILVGDEQQLPSIERGGLFGALKERHGAAELHEVVRVSDAEQKRAFNLMHQGQFLPALSILSKQGLNAINWSGRQTEAFSKLVALWDSDTAADPTKARFVFAYTNADVDALNLALRQARQGGGSSAWTTSSPQPTAMSALPKMIEFSLRGAPGDAPIAMPVSPTALSAPSAKSTASR